MSIHWPFHRRKIPAQTPLTVPVPSTLESAILGSGLGWTANPYWSSPLVDRPLTGHDPLCHIDPSGTIGHHCYNDTGQPVIPGEACALSARIDAAWIAYDQAHPQT